jgi:DnaJ-class molecular chaperone
MKKNFANLNYYEILDVTPDAAFFEIRHAYNASMQMYRADSLVSYSFFSLEERQEILNLLEKAYLTLINGKERKNYDKELIQLGILENVGGRAGVKRSAGIYDASRQWGRAAVLKNNTTSLKEKVVQNKRINEILSKQKINGADLKAIRNELGVAIEKIAGETKIRLDYLISIEEDKVKRLPAAIFLKGFIKSYLKCLCIEPLDDVCVRYMDSLARIGKNN